MVRHRLDPEVLAVLDRIESEGGPALETLPVAEARELGAAGLRPFAGEPQHVAHVEDLSIDGGPRLRVYTADAPSPRPALVYFHGGGWVLCDLDTHDVVCRAIANAARAVVIAVDYRLAPEHPFPAAVEDCCRAVEWVAANAARLGIDPDRISAGGDSAGGNLAAVMCLRARDHAGPKLAAQILIYPVTDLSSFETPSYTEFADGYFLTRTEMEWFRGHYLADPEDAANCYASPLLAHDLSRLPPALVITAECDVLRDEGEAYAQRLRDAGVPVRSTRYPGMIHPFFSMPGAIGAARAAIEEVAAVTQSPVL